MYMILFLFFSNQFTCGIFLIEKTFLLYCTFNAVNNNIIIEIREKNYKECQTAIQKG